jgi:S-formylglutathione hydrolase FrmB
VPETASLPVIYLLHGVPGSAADASRTGIIAATAAAIENGIGPVVLVLPDGNGDRADTEWADSSDGRDLVATRVIRSVIPAVEGANPRPRGRRAVVGFSMGGFGAANLALRNPGRFGQWVSLDGYFRIDDPDGMFADRADRQANSPELHAAAASDQRVLLIEGLSEKGPLVPGEAIRMAGLLRRTGADVTVRMPAGSHSWPFVVSQWPPILQWLQTGWSPA